LAPQIGTVFQFLTIAPLIVDLALKSQPDVFLFSGERGAASAQGGKKTM
jgi:hypothetical protein